MIFQLYSFLRATGVTGCDWAAADITGCDWAADSVTGCDWLAADVTGCDWATLFKNMGWPNKTINRNKENHIKMAEFKETRIQTGIQKKHSTGQKRSKNKTETFLGQIITNLEHETYRTQNKVYKILKQISNDVKERARIQGNIDENVFLKYYVKL